MKNKIILIVLILLCFIPSAVAYSSYKQTQNAPVDAKTATKISIDDLNEKNFTFVREEEDDEAAQLISFFMEMNQNATPIVALPDSLMTEKCYRVTISTSIKDESYMYYFSPDPTTNYFVSQTGGVYHIAEADAKRFISTVYAESIYETSSVPALTLSGMYSVTPDTAKWQYKNYTGEYVDSDTAEMVFTETEYYELEGGFNLDFDVEPDYFNVKIVDSVGNILFDDYYGNLETLTFTANTNISVDVAARWYEDPSRSFCGELNYSFTSLVTAPAEFYLGVDTVERGGFVAITGVNVTNPDRINFSTNIPGGATPKFYKDSGYAVGLLPIDIDTVSGIYQLTFIYGGTTQVLSLYVEDKSIGVSQVTVDSAMLNKTRTQATVSEFQTTAADIMSKSVTERHFSGSFLEGAPNSDGLLRGFGRDVVINGDQSNTYRNNGVDYSAMAGSSVYACNAGEVVYSGSMAYTGNIVVIDHGLGLKTWYYNMGSCEVSVGDIVAKGDVIGTCGSTGFITMTSGVHIAMSVGDRFVCPYDTWQSSSAVGCVKMYGIEQ
ncbi:MAG: M23 family metallopeptidase [Ruminococcaceae bacterium]|nr:M23 family metallopeptidase [Oscillospiraceae bacterium]